MPSLHRTWQSSLWLVAWPVHNAIQQNSRYYFETLRTTHTKLYRVSLLLSCRYSDFFGSTGRQAVGIVVLVIGLLCIVQAIVLLSIYGRPAHCCGHDGYHSYSRGVTTMSDDEKSHLRVAGDVLLATIAWSVCNTCHDNHALYSLGYQPHVGNHQVCIYTLDG